MVASATDTHPPLPPMPDDARSSRATSLGPVTWGLPDDLVKASKAPAHRTACSIASTVTV